MGNIRHMVLGVIGTTLAASTVFGSERELDAHQHGHGVLNIAIEDQMLWIELEAPGDDIVGFEHPASSEEDKAAIESAKAKLGDPFSLFGIPADASCTLDEAAVSLNGGAPDDHGDHHDDHDDHDASDADVDHHDDDAEQETRHTEFHAVYRLVCAGLTGVEALSLRYFTVFPAAQELDVSVIAEGGQYRQEVTGVSPIVHLTGD